MSRIYEALRRAERERAGLQSAAAAAPFRQAEPDQAPPVHGTVPAHEALPEHEAALPAYEGLPEHEAALPAYEAASVQAMLPAASPVSSSAAPPAATLPDLPQLGTVALRPWTPSIERLPALLERGRTVEQFRSLRSRMQELREAGPLKSILVSSGLPQEGKSFVAANLAISLARAKTSRVLLIDGDMRRCSLHTLLGCSNDAPGLTDYLAGSATLEQIMQARSPEGVPAGQDLPSLTFIAAGAASDKASDLSGNHRFEELMKAAWPHFEWIIVDSSPVNLVADGINLARACDGVLLIARGGVTKFTAAQRAVAAFKSARLLGFVLNAALDAAAVGEYYEYEGYVPAAAE